MAGLAQPGGTAMDAGYGFNHSDTPVRRTEMAVKFVVEPWV
jgi:hypothetical protein